MILKMNTKAEEQADEKKEDYYRNRIFESGLQVFHPMKCDFSELNLQYLIQARDIAKEDPEHAAVILGINKRIAKELATLSPAALSMVSKIKVPLIGPNQPTWWWERLLRALDDERSDEVQAIMEHANLLAITKGNGSNEG